MKEHIIPKQEFRREFQRELQIAHSLVKQAGERLMDFFQKANFSIYEKGINNPVTEADYAANTILIEGLMKFFPDDAILSEEVSDGFDRQEMEEKRKTASRVWIIDPLDGTKEFIAGLPHFAVSLALWQEGKAVLGFVYNPAEDFFIYGGKQCGVFFNGEKFKKAKSQITSMDNMRFCLSRSEMKKGLFDHLTKHFEILPQNIVGSIAYKLALLAYGRCDLVISLKPKNEWDFAAGAALLAANGDQILDPSFQEIKLNKENPLSQGLICGSPAHIQLYADFIKL